MSFEKIGVGSNEHPEIFSSNYFVKTCKTANL